MMQTNRSSVFTQMAFCVFYLFNYFNVWFIFNWKHFSCFILNKIFHVGVLMHYCNSISFQYHIVKQPQFFPTKTQEVAAFQSHRTIRQFRKEWCHEKTFRNSAFVKTSFQSLSATVNLYSSAKHSNQCTNVAFPSLLVSQRTLSYRTLGYLKIFSIQALHRSDILATPGHRANPSGIECTGFAICLIQVALAPAGRQMMAGVVPPLFSQGRW